MSRSERFSICSAIISSSIVVACSTAHVLCHVGLRSKTCIFPTSNKKGLSISKRHSMGLLPDTYYCGLHMRRECRENFPAADFKGNRLVSDPGMHHGTCITYVPWCMSGSLTRGGGENVPGIPGACATRNFTYLARGPRIRFPHYWPFVTGICRCWFTSQRDLMRRFDVLNKLLKQMPRSSCDVTAMILPLKPTVGC